MRKLFILIALLLPVLVAHAQYQSLFGRFQVDQKKGCAPHQIQISYINGWNCNSNCQMYFGDGVSLPNTDTHTYTQPGKYWLKILFQASSFDSIQIEVVPNIQPSFEVYGCTGNAVSFKVTDTNYNQYVVDFNDGSPTSTLPSGSGAQGIHTYAAAGSQSITIRGRNLNAADNCNSTTHTFNALATLPSPTFDQLMLQSASQAQLDMVTDQYIQYKLEIGTNTSASFQPFQNIYNTNTTTIPNLSADQNYYCFRLATHSPCTNTSNYANAALICTADFDLSVQNNRNDLSWRTSTTGVSTFDVYRNDQPILTLPNTANNANDPNVVCKTEYCYQLITTYANGSESYSLKKCGTAFSTTQPTAIQDITAVVDQASVILDWVQDPAFTVAEYSIFKAENGNGYGLAGKSTTPTYTDATYNTATPTCYQVTYVDLCDNQSIPAVTSCPVQLTGILNDDNTIALNWSAYTGWQNGVSGYTLEKYDADGNLLQSFPVGTATTYTDNSNDPNTQIYIYVVKVTANDAALNQAVSNVFTIIKEPNLYYPTAFTPNSDGLNDSFRVYGQYITAFTMRIFDRWGEMVFNATDITQGWDGTYRGKVLPEGTYVFVADITDLAGRTFNRSGSVLLLRKR